MRNGSHFASAFKFGKSEEPHTISGHRIFIGDHAYVAERMRFQQGVDERESGDWFVRVGGFRPKNLRKLNTGNVLALQQE